MKLIKTTENGLLKFTNIDAIAGNTLAEKLEVRHFDVMKTIKKVMKYEKTRKEVNEHHRSPIIHIEEEKNQNFNAVFKEWEYTSPQNKTYKTYIMNEDALYLVIANMKGQKAHNIKVQFKSDFNNMRSERDFRDEVRELEKEHSDLIKKVADMMKKEGSTNSHFMYPTMKRQLVKGSIGQSVPKGGIDYDTKDTDELIMIGESLKVIMKLIKSELLSGATGYEIKDAVKDKCGSLRYQWELIAHFFNTSKAWNESAE